MMQIISHPAFYWSVIALVGSGLLLYAISFPVASYFVYVRTLKRSDKEQWSRELPSDLAPDSLEMYRIGAEWAEQNKEYKKDVHIVSDGLNLYGEYYDFGSKSCVVILSGRTECLKYGYYFSIPYHKKGLNVLVIDPRAHGLSDGEYNTVGFEESKDAIKWFEFAIKELKVEKIVVHGICIGAAGGMLAVTDKSCPEQVKAIITEGMFPNFGESMKNHLKEKKKPVFVHKLVNLWMKKYTGHTMYYGPIDVIDKLDKPLLMLHSKKDLYSRPEKAKELFEKAGVSDKKIVWFDEGKHSFLRITDTERYDNSIIEFLSEHDI